MAISRVRSFPICTNAMCLDIQRAEIYPFFLEKVTSTLSPRRLSFTRECHHYEHSSDFSGHDPTPPHTALCADPRAPGKSPFLRKTTLRAWGWPQSWQPRHCSHTFTWAKGFKPIAWKAPSSHTPPQSKKEQWEMLLRVGAEGARGWRPGGRTQPSVPAQHHQPVGVRRPPLALAPRPASELPAAA